jgi:hypothetical protein
MGINVKLLARLMGNAARAVLADRWQDARALAETQLKRLAQDVSDIEGLLRTGDLDETRARLLFEMYRNTIRTTLMTIEGIGVTTAEDVVSGALQAVTGGIARSLGINR